MEEVASRVIGVVNEIRRHILLLAGAIAAGTLGFYFVSPAILAFFQRHLDQKLAFFSVTGPFLAHVKLAFFVTIIVLMPAIVQLVWMSLAKPFNLSKGQRFWFVLFTTLLFYSGAAFCFFITLPFGVRFLLGFQSVELKPVISISKFVSFLSIFIVAFGLIFELPIFMVFAAKVGLIKRALFEKNRRYAVLAISIVSALLTPTPDVVNMLLMGGPLYLLYEVGILVIKVLRIE